MSREKKPGISTSSSKRPKDQTQKRSLNQSSSPRSSCSISRSEPQTMEALLAETGYHLKGVKKGEIIKGIIVSLPPKEVFIDIGGKTEAVLATREREEVTPFLENLKIGDTVSAYVILAQNEAGQSVVSFRKAAADFKWDRAESLLSSGEAVKVRGLETNKGGLIVDFEGLRGFVPSSQLGAEHVGRERSLVNTALTVKVIEVDRSKNRLVFSEKKVLPPEEEKKRQEIWQKTSVGDKVKGEVVAVLPFGVFLDIKGVEGLIHISEIAWEKVETPHDYFKKGDKVKALVVDRDEENQQFQLSIKQLTADPWGKAAKKYKKNQVVSGKVIKKEPYGAFVRLEEGLDALLHISKIPQDTAIKIGEELSCVIESIEPEKRRISLTLLPTEKPVGYK